MRTRRSLIAFAALLLSACHRPARPHGRFTLSVVGTNDLHGHLESLPIFGGFVANLRRVRAQDGGAVVLVDAGDMFQGTLESNLNEGAAVVRAYAALGYLAVAIGNHEFDYGPVGPAVSVAAGQAPAPSSEPAPEQDPRGALRARAAEAPFPFLDANLVDTATGRPPAWTNVVPGVVREVKGVKVGILGVTTSGTPRLTLAANFAGLAVTPLAPAIVATAADLRRQGATVVIALAHAGGDCHRFDDPADLSTCDKHDEIFDVARALPAGTVDLIVAGHTHKGVAHRVNGIPVVEAFSNGRAFDRVDLTIDRATGRVIDATIFAPHDLPWRDSVQLAAYEGEVVSVDRPTAAAVAQAEAAAAALREQRLGVDLAEPLPRAQKTESALGNLVTDLMRAARPGADVALMNGGGLRADLPIGPLTYGRLYEALPFDNRFATLPVTAAELAAVIAANLSRSNGIISVSGVRATARCAAGSLAVTLARSDGRPILPDTRLSLLTSDFLATGGDDLLPDAWQRRATLDGGPPIRDALAEQLRARGHVPAPRDLVPPAAPRLEYPGKRPVHCR
ncbi:MAG TPA: bifunctional UDP-sugar hydrolase/5'-nucleotidase [Polyangia bacterium]|nr:bifunctional UDP-sugar hydrolase/5'-nucleotidase [Polyangia bacterium]